MATKSAFVTPFRVGLVVIAGIAAFFVLLSFVAKQKYSETETYVVHAVFRDATGLGEKSRVQIAGIEVGIVDKIVLTADAKARATLRIRNDVVLHEDARIVKRSASLLGDFLLDLYPGTPEAPAIANGGEIDRVVAQAGVDDVFAALGEVTRDIQQVTKSLKDLVASDEVGSIKEIIRSMNDVALGLNKTISQAGGRLDTILGDVEYLSGSVRHLASGQTRNVTEILDNVRIFTDQANKLVGTIQTIVGTGEGELKSSVAGVRDTLDELQKTLKGTQKLIENADATVSAGRTMVERVDKGEGTLGTLLRDDGIAMKLEKTIDDIGTITRPLADLQTHVHLREEVHWRPGARVPSGKASVDIQLVPRPTGKFYGVGIVSEPRGNTTTELVQTRHPETGALITSEQTVTTNDDVKLNAYIGNRFGTTALRVGLIEDTGGLGADVYAVSDSLRFSVDAFDFTNPDARFPRLRASAQWRFGDHLYLGAGADDVLNFATQTNRPDSGAIQSGLDFFVSGGLQFNDEDLKALLTIIGVPAVN